MTETKSSPKYSHSKSIALSPTKNITHNIHSPSGGVQTATSTTISYLPPVPGTYTYCLTNDLNGCTTCEQFVVNALYTGLNAGQISPLDLTVFPNPSSDFIVIAGLETLAVTDKIEIANNLGQCVLSIASEAGYWPKK